MIWTKIKGFPYEVSRTGKIRSQERSYVNQLGARCHKVPFIRKTRTNNINPHLFVDLGCYKKGVYIRKTQYVHLAVMKAYGPKRPSKQHVCSHKDGNYENNHINNLYWRTLSEVNREKAIKQHKKRK